MTGRNILLILCLLMLGVTAWCGESPESRFADGNAAYQAGKHTEAIQLYEQLLTEGWQSEELHYNLANAYQQNQQLGKAILHYEKTLLLDPDHTDARYNLQLVKTQLPDQFEAVPVLFLKRWWASARDLLGSGAWGVVTLLLLWGGIIGVIVWLMAKQRRTKKRGFVLGTIALMLMLLPFMLGRSRLAFERDSGKAVIQAEAQGLHPAPDQLSQALRELHAGTVVDILDEFEDWYKVRLVNGEEGWLPKKELEKI